MLETKNLSVRYGSQQILKNVSFSVEAGQWLMVIGHNGAGKSTIINAVSRGVPYEGTIYFEGKDIQKYRGRELARCLGVLTQHHYVGYGFTVEEVIRLGRYAHAPGMFEGGKDDSEERFRKAVDQTGLNDYLTKSVTTLSGGELQRTFLAQLFLQDPKLLILDEPTNHLDLIYQKQVFSLVQDWISQTGGAVISVVHDLSLARAYGTHGILMRQGEIVARGTMEDIVSPDQLNPVYNMDVYDWMRQMYGQWISI